MDCVLLSSSCAASAPWNCGARENAEKTSAVHFLRFELSPSMIAAAQSGGSVSVGVDHENYRHSIAPLPAAVRDALVLDLG